MFKRRVPLSTRQKLAHMIWPHMGLKRLFLYYKHRMGRLPGTPAEIAAGLATGVAISFTPFIGLHMMIGAAICWAFGFSVVGMLLGTVIAGNPWTFSVIWVASFKLGHVFLAQPQHADMPQEFSLDLMIKHPLDVFLPMVAGSIPFVVLSAVLVFYGARRLITTHRRHRFEKIQARSS